MPARTTTISRSDSRRRLLIAITTFLLISFLVIRTSDAAFTASQTNPGNDFAAATIDLTGTTQPLFGDGLVAQTHALDLYPGNAVSACIDITYDGEIVDPDITSVQLSLSDTTANTLAGALDLTVEVLDDCTNANVESTPISGVALSSVTPTDSGWTPNADNDARGFRFTVEVADDDTLQGETLNDVDITWSLETT